MRVAVLTISDATSSGDRADVSVALSGGHYRYGKKATVTVTLHGHKSTSPLELYAATPDGKLYFLKRGRPDSHGRLVVRTTMSVNAAYIGVFDGDAAVAVNGAVKRVKGGWLSTGQATTNRPWALPAILGGDTKGLRT